MIVQKNEVYAINAGAHFSKPGPRTITGLEELAKIDDQEGFEDDGFCSHLFATTEGLIILDTSATHQRASYLIY